MASMIILDANVLISLFDSEDANHGRAKQLLLAHANEPMEMSALTLTEFLVRPTQSGMAAKAEALIASLGIIVSPIVAADAHRLANVRATSGLKMPDAAVLWLAQSSAGQLMTMDEHLAQVAARVGVPVIH